MENTRIAFFGTPQNAAIVLEKLIQGNLVPQMIITSPDSQKGRGQKLAESPVKILAEVHKINVYQPQNITAFAEEFKKLEPEIAVLVAYGKIIPKEILEMPKFGFLNVHPSLLPKYRGPSPFVEPILNGDEKTGATIIKLDSELDHGPILAQKEIKIEETDTHQSLLEKTAILGADLLIESLPKYLEDSPPSFKLKPQDDTKATYTKKTEKEDGRINLENPPDPKTLDRMIRAYYPWPTVWTQIEGKIIKFLPQSKIQPEGKKPMTKKEFQNGYPKIAQALKFLT